MLHVIPCLSLLAKYSESITRPSGSVNPLMFATICPSNSSEDNRCALFVLTNDVMGTMVSMDVPAKTWSRGAIRNVRRGSFELIGGGMMFTQTGQVDERAEDEDEMRMKIDV